MKKLLLFIFFVIIYCQFPLEYKLIKSSGHLNRYEHNSIKGQLANNAVIDIKKSKSNSYSSSRPVSIGINSRGEVEARFSF